VLMLEPNRTPLDLNWRMFGIPVRIHPLFWAVTALLGWSSMALGFKFLLLWIGCVFVSILIHELGHVFMGRFFGADGHIVLYSFGGLAIGSNALSNRWQRIAVSIAGPLADFLLLGVLMLGLFFYDRNQVLAFPEKVKAMLGLPYDTTFFSYKQTLQAVAIDNLIWINLVWGVVNLLPIWPLDGGQVSRDLLDWFFPRQGLRLSLVLSVVVAGLMVIPFLYRKEYYNALFFGLLGLSCFMTLQQLRKVQGPRGEDPDDRWHSDRAPWERDPDYWKH
jgi:stage IV sporulation protein FB